MHVFRLLVENSLLLPTRPYTISYPSRNPDATLPISSVAADFYVEKGWFHWFGPGLECPRPSFEKATDWKENRGFNQAGSGLSGRQQASSGNTYIHSSTYGEWSISGGDDITLDVCTYFGLRTLWFSVRRP